MTITVDRKWKKENYTIGRLYVDKKLLCNTLEDPDRGLRDDMTIVEIRRKKIYGDTAIPTGKYLISWTYSERFKKYMPLVNNVKGFEGVRIHSGNGPQDTLGCILVGANTEVGRITNSRAWTNHLYDLIKNKIDKEQVWLVIK